MKIIELFEGNNMSQDEKHQATLDKTGFWGNRAAGCIVLAKDTGNLLIAHRSESVQEPNTFGTWGGAIDDKEDPVRALKRELYEEAGYTGAVHFEPLYVFKKPGFTYYNFLATVAKEFEPELNWESQGFVWCTLDDLPHPLHFGLKSLFADHASMQKIQAAIAACKKEPGSPE